jgi:hypothetical protein
MSVAQRLRFTHSRMLRSDALEEYSLLADCGDRIALVVMRRINQPG